MNVAKVRRNTQRKHGSWPVYLGYLGALFAYLFFAQDGYSTDVRVLAWVVFVVGSMPAVSYISNRRLYFPVIEIIFLSYVNAFSLPVFFQVSERIMVKTLLPAGLPLAFCMLLVLFVMATLWLGFRLAPSLLKGIKSPNLAMNCSNNRLFLYGCLLCLLSFMASFFSFGPYQGLINVVTSSVLGVALLSYLFWKRKLGLSKRIVFFSLVSLLVLEGVSTGMTQAMLEPLFVVYVCRCIVLEKLSIHYVVLGVVAFVLIQPVKLEYRAQVWGVASQKGLLEKVDIFTSKFYDHWFSSDGENRVAESTYNRTSLLLSTSHVIDWTPSVVPYAGGRTLYFLPVNWIPRFIWPNKPIAQQANIDFAIDYGVTTVRGARSTMFGVGHLGEAFMNFGAKGIGMVFLVIGFLTYLPLHILRFSKQALGEFRSPQGGNSIASMSILTAVLLQFIYIGSSLGDSYGGVIQLIIVHGVGLHFFARKKAGLGLPV